jgi:D-serine deaminase-like pyridoxal phosphate-dependent protein
MDDVSSRELLCRPLAALKDNRAEAEQLRSDSPQAVANAVPVTNYRPGLYVMMDWVASRLHKAGAAAWALILDGEEVECLSLLSLCVG